MNQEFEYTAFTETDLIEFRVLGPKPRVSLMNLNLKNPKPCFCKGESVCLSDSVLMKLLSERSGQWF